MLVDLRPLNFSHFNQSAMINLNHSWVLMRCRCRLNVCESAAWDFPEEFLILVGEIFTALRPNPDP